MITHDDAPVAADDAKPSYLPPGAGGPARLPPLGRTRPMIVMLAIASAFGLGVGFVPQLGGPGYEISLVSGAVLPSALAVCSALELAARRPEPFDAYCRGIANGALVFAVTVLISLLHGLRVGLCDVLAGLQNLALGPGVGLALAGAWSAVVAEVAGRTDRPRRRSALAVTLALAGPLGCIALGFVRFYTSPMIFGFDPFVGYFSGTLYDTVVELGGLATYRLGSAATLFAGFVLALHLGHGPRGRLVYQSIGRPGLVALGILSATASIAITLAGAELGHWHTRDSIARELGAAIDGERCDVIHSRAIAPEKAQRFARECEAHVIAAEEWLGVKGPDRITAFLFEDASQKQRLMGASGTNIAKPWRAEVYVQGTSYPHRVLGHEVMHVVAAGAARGPFRTAGELGGYLPNPGLIEGLAVAGSPRDEDLTPMEWAKAMKDLSLLPPLERLFALGFLGEHGALAYTVSGAFVGWVHEKFGAAVVRDWYGGRELAELTGRSWQDLEAAWHADLDALSLPEAVRVQAAARFDKPGFFRRRCPRVVDACRQRANELDESGDPLGAILELDRALDLEPDNVGLALDRAAVLLDVGRETEGLETLGRVAADEAAKRHARDRALRIRGDHALASGDVEEASRAYTEIIPRTSDAGDLRTLQVKLAATRDEGLRPAVVALLLGAPGKRADKVAAAELLGALSHERPLDGLPAYLLARHYYDAGEFAEAGKRLDYALARKITIRYVRPEALRLRIGAACAVGDGAGARRWLDEYAREADVTRARYQNARRLVARCAAVPISELPQHASAAAGERRP